MTEGLRLGSGQAPGMEDKMSEAIYDVIVLGGGAGGVPAFIRASQLGGHGR